MQRRAFTALAAAAAITLVAGCAGLGFGDPLNVAIVGFEPLQGEGLEARFALKLRVQNPSDTAFAFNGAALTVFVRGERFATGVSSESGTVPRFGETVITVPVSVPASALLGQVLNATSADPGRFDYRVRGTLHATEYGSRSFDSTGELRVPGTR
jgi:hypothetical protein